MHSLCGNFADIDSLSRLKSRASQSASNNPAERTAAGSLYHIFVRWFGRGSARSRYAEGKLLLVIKREMRFHLGRWRCAMQGTIHKTRPH